MQPISISSAASDDFVHQEHLPPTEQNGWMKTRSDNRKKGREGGKRRRGRRERRRRGEEEERRRGGEGGEGGEGGGRRGRRLEVQRRKRRGQGLEELGDEARMNQGRRRELLQETARTFCDSALVSHSCSSM